LIGRQREIELLNKLCDTNNSKVVHGRRRIGKTYLINYMFKINRDDCIFFEYTGSDDQDADTQRLNFIEAVYDWFKVEPTKPITTWAEAFIFLKRTIENEIAQKNHKGKVVIFIDEVAWVDKHNKAGFLSAFGHFYNTYCQKKENIITILCGSNASWIKNKILKDTKGPLYQRVDLEIPMLPFTLKETKEYLIKEKKFELDNKSATDIYMILGGVAKYLSFLDSSLSISQNIDNLFFTISAPLFDEYDAIFKSLFYDKHTFHRQIIDILCSKQSGFTITQLGTIIDKEQTDPTNKKLRNAIVELIDTGFIKPLNKLHNKTRETKYIIADPFCLFHYKWVRELSKNDIVSMKNHFTNIISSPSYSIWCGFVFEAVMMINIDLYLQKRGLLALYKNITYWQYIANPQIEDDKGTQIDMVIEYENNIYDIVECKYYNGEFTISKEYADNLRHKVAKFKEHAIKQKMRYDLKLVMLTTYGTKKNSHFNALNISSDITLNDLLI
jgi:AAA+ ATPase superfamily predicted ATPase